MRTKRPKKRYKSVDDIVFEIDRVKNMITHKLREMETYDAEAKEINKWLWDWNMQAVKPRDTAPYHEKWDRRTLCVAESIKAKRSWNHFNKKLGKLKEAMAVMQTEIMDFLPGGSIT